tara:strand:- start:1008 stop:1655 length:648 start_codon:yes stop_codon:yes gene_type:complete
MKEIIYIDSTNFIDIRHQLKSLNVKAAHFTNGIYALDAQLVVPTMLAGFKYVNEKQDKLPLIIAINSDVSIKELKKGNLEKQEIRAQKVAVPLAKVFPDNQVIIIYYDQATPTALYESLKKGQHTRSLHKWEYGKDFSAPKIEGAEHFDQVFSFPFLNTDKPMCYSDTGQAHEEQNIQIIDLKDKLISTEGLLFDLPDELQQFSANKKQISQNQL